METRAWLFLEIFVMTVDHNSCCVMLLYLIKAVRGTERESVFKTVEKGRM